MTPTQPFYFPHVVPRHLRHNPGLFAECVMFGGVTVWRRAVQESYRETKRRIRRNLHAK